jgi:uncharacterized protein
MSKSSPTPFASRSESLAAREVARPTQVASQLESEFSLEERRILLRIAHHAILSALENQNPDDRGSWRTQGNAPALPPEAPAALSEARGVFTTLYLKRDLHRELRGCVGYVAPVAPLYRAVAETACAAAFEDSRFLPLAPEEAPRLEVSLSVLSLLFPIRSDAVEVGRHGLVISRGVRRGLLLPQVPVEQGWDRETFLDQTCRKAGLPLDAWCKDATIEAFTAEVFGDSDVDKLS